MSDESRFETLWNDYLEGDLEDSDLAELQGLIESNGELVQIAADHYQTHRLLGVISEDNAMRKDEFIRETMDRLTGAGRESSRWWQKGSDLRQDMRFAIPAFGVAAALLIVASVFLFRTTESPIIAHIVDMEGWVHWTSYDGSIQEDLETGSEVSSGVLESMSADSWIEIEFLDQSRVTIFGRSELAIKAGGRSGSQKYLALKEGSLSATVTPQAEGRPMVIATSTVHLEVLGTQLNVDYDSGTTQLTVNEGVVRATRLIDGSVSDVVANHQIVASADSKDIFEAKPRAKPVQYWTCDLYADASEAILEQDTVEDRLLLKTKPKLMKDFKKDFNSKTTKNLRTEYLCGLTVFDALESPVVLARNGSIRVQGRASKPFYFGIVTRHADGGFAGKYDVLVDPSEWAIDRGEFDVVIPVDDFWVRQKITQSAPIGKEIMEIWCSTRDVDSDLSIFSVEIVPPSDSSGSSSGV